MWNKATQILNYLTLSLHNLFFVLEDRICHNNRFSLPLTENVQYIKISLSE